MIGAPRAPYALAAAMHSAMWGLYFTFTRYYVSEDLGGGSRAVMLLTGLEWSMILFALAFERLVRVAGTKRALQLGALGFVPMVAAAFTKDVVMLLLVLSLTSLFWATSWPTIIAAVLGSSPSPGRAYSTFTMGTGLGYAIGSALAGALRATVRPEHILGVNGAMYLLTYAFFIAFYPGGRERGSLPRNPIRENSARALDLGLAAFLVSLGLSTFAREIYYAVAPAKIVEDLDTLMGGSRGDVGYVLFGLLYSGLPALLSIPARIVAGTLADRSPLALYLVAVSSYTASYWAFTSTSGVIPIIMWQAPLFPFLDTAINAYIAYKYPRSLLARIYGLVIAANAIGGLLLIPTMLCMPGDRFVLGLVMTAASGASLTLACIAKRS